MRMLALFVIFVVLAVFTGCAGKETPLPTQQTTVPPTTTAPTTTPAPVATPPATTPAPTQPATTPPAEGS